MIVVNGRPSSAYTKAFQRSGDINGDSWNTSNEKVFEDDFVGSLDIAIINSNPAIAYARGGGTALYYARSSNVNGDSW